MTAAQDYHANELEIVRDLISRTILAPNGTQTGPHKEQDVTLNRSWISESFTLACGGDCPAVRRLLLFSVGIIRRTLLTIHGTS